jgi:hypothetical protein
MATRDNVVQLFSGDEKADHFRAAEMRRLRLKLSGDPSPHELPANVVPLPRDETTARRQAAQALREFCAEERARLRAKNAPALGLSKLIALHCPGP